MSDQQVTTTLQAMAPAPAAPAVRPVPPEEDALREKAIMSLLHAVDLAADSASSAMGAQDAQDFSRAALQLAQAAVILDPNLVAPQGVPPNALHPPVPHIQMQKSPPPPPPPAQGPTQGAGGGKPS